jgi:hypothetical protein
LVPLQPAPLPVFVAAPVPVFVAAPQPAEAANEARSMNTPGLQQSAQAIQNGQVLPAVESHDVLLFDADLVVVEQVAPLTTDLLAQTQVEPQPAAQVEQPVAEQVEQPVAAQADIVEQAGRGILDNFAVSNANSRSQNLSYEPSPITDSDRERLKAFVLKVDIAIASNEQPLAEITEYEQALFRRLHKRGRGEHLTAFCNELVALLFAERASFFARRRIFCLLTGRSEECYRKLRRAYAAQRDSNNNK